MCTRILSTFLFVLSAMLLLKSQSTPELMAESFFETFTKRGSKIALDELYATNEWMSLSADAIQSLQNQMASLTPDFVGECHGYELITTRKLTESYILLSYLVKFDRQPLRFIFQFYKPLDKWRVYSFQYDGNLDSELEESARILNLNSKPRN